MLTWLYKGGYYMALTQPPNTKWFHPKCLPNFKKKICDVTCVVFHLVLWKYKQLCINWKSMCEYGYTLGGSRGALRYFYLQTEPNTVGHNISQCDLCLRSFKSLTVCDIDSSAGCSCRADEPVCQCWRCSWASGTRQLSAEAPRQRCGAGCLSAARLGL